MAGCGLKAPFRNQFLAGMIFVQSGRSVFQSFGFGMSVKTLVRSATNKFKYLGRKKT